MDSLLDKKLLGFRQVAQEKLQHIFYSIPSEKDLIIEPSLIKPLEYVCGASWLRKKGIDKIYKFDQKNPPPKRKQFVYFITANLLTFKCVLDQISGYHSQTSSMMEPDLRTQQYHILVFPLVMASFEHLLEEEGLFGVAELYSFQWDFLLLDHSVLSLELPNIFADVFVRKDTALLASMAQSLRLFNLIMGKPKLIFALGENAEKVLQMVQRIESTDGPKTPTPEEKEPDFSVMLVVDRDRDYPTCLLTPVVYSGLLLEIHKLTSGSLVVDAATNKIKSGKLSILRGGLAKVTPEAGGGTSLRMSGTQDKVYQEHRYRHFSEVISLLSAQAKALGVEGKAYSRDMKLNEMKDYVTNKLPRVAAQKKELFKHLLLCETIVEEIGATFEKHQMIEESVLANTNRKQIMSYIEELLSSDAHRYNTLRLICLYHVTIGLTSDDMTKLMTGYLNAFGYHHLTVFHKLFQAKLFPDTTNLIKGKMLSQISIPILKTPFQIEANKLKLLPTDANEGSAAVVAAKLDRDNASGAKSGSPSFVFNGNYIPLVAQLTQIILGAANCDELNAKLGHLERLKLSGKVLGDTATHPRTIKELSISGHKANINKALPLRPKTFFVLVIGGLTYAEIAACATLEKLLGAKIVLASDTIVAGHDLIERVVDC